MDQFPNNPKGPEPESTVQGSARLSRPATDRKRCGYSFGNVWSRALKYSLALLVTNRVSNEDLSKMQIFRDTRMHENSIELTCNQVFLFFDRKVGMSKMVGQKNSSL